MENDDTPKPARHNRDYSTEEDATVSFLFKQGRTDEEIGSVMGRTDEAIAQVRRRLKLFRAKRGRPKDPGGEVVLSRATPLKDIMAKGGSNAGGPKRGTVQSVLPQATVFDHLKTIEKHLLDQADQMAKTVGILTEIKILIRERSK